MLLAPDISQVKRQDETKEMEISHLPTTDPASLKPTNFIPKPGDTMRRDEKSRNSSTDDAIKQMSLLIQDNTSLTVISDVIVD